MSDQNPKLIVSKSNVLIDAAYSLTLNESRLLLLAISKIDPRKPNHNNITISAEDYARMFSVPMNKSYQALKTAGDGLFESDIRTFDGKNDERIRWIDKNTYAKGEGSLTIHFTQWVAPYISKLHTRFTSYELRLIANLSSPYAIRLLEMLMQYKASGFYVVTLEDLRERLELNGKYERFSNLAARVLKPSIKDLVDNSGMKITMKAIRKGKTVQRLEFRFSINNQLQLV